MCCLATQPVSGAFANLRKTIISFVLSVCPSVRMEQLSFHRADFHEIWNLRSFRKSVEETQIISKQTAKPTPFLLPALLCTVSSVVTGTSPSKPLTSSFPPISALSIFRIFIQDWSLGKTKLRINANNVCVIPYFEIRYVVRLLRHFVLHLVQSDYPPHGILGSRSLETQIPHNSRAARLTIPRNRK